LPSRNCGAARAWGGKGGSALPPGAARAWGVRGERQFSPKSDYLKRYS